MCPANSDCAIAIPTATFSWAFSSPDRIADGQAYAAAMIKKKPWFEGFVQRHFEFDGSAVHARVGGREDAPPLMLVHGFPQTHAMWQRVASSSTR